MSLRFAKYLIPFIYLARSSAQELFVFPEIALLAESDLRKLNCDVPPAAQHLEMLSPGVFKNSWFSLLLIVKHGSGQRFVVDGGQNPANTFDVQLRRLLPGPDAVLFEDVPLPFEGRIGEGQRCAVFVLDAWVKTSESPERVKLEPSIWAPKPGTEGYWQRYPMEVRVLATQLPDAASIPVSCNPTPQELVQEFAAAVVNSCRPRNLSCRVETPQRLENLLLRNLSQDLAAEGELKPCGDVSIPMPLPASLLKLRAKWASGK